MEKENMGLWETVERDKLKYKAFLLISLATWALTIAVLAYIGYFFYLEHEHLQGQYVAGFVNKIDVYEAKKNIFFIVLSMSMIVACLSSIVVIMRQRSASLKEIQLRLAMLESRFLCEKE